MDQNLNLLADQLVKAGVRWAFGVTGSGPTLNLISRLEERGVSYVPASHEAAAALMAGAVSRATGQVSCAISIKGPGLANMIAGIASNYFENAIVVSVSEAFGDKTPVSRQHKRLDQKTLLQPVVKARLSLNHSPKYFSQLIAAALSEAPGPVHIDLCEENPKTGVWFRKKVRPTPFAPSSVFKKMLIHSKRPVVIAGSLAQRRGWGAALANLRVPVFTTTAAKGVISEMGTYSAGIFTGTGKELSPESVVISQSDLVIGVGLRNTEVVQAQGFGRPTILFDELKSDLSQGFEDHGIFDMSKNKTAEALWTQLANQNWGADLLRDVLGKMRQRLLSSAWLPAQCFDRLNRIENNHGLVLDTGSFCTIGEHLWQAKEGREFLGSSNGRFMGTAIPTAIGFSLSRPNLPIFCVSGDGGFRMYPSEIKIAAEKKLPICFVLMMDGHYASIACAPQKGAVSQVATRLIRPSWLESVAGMGVHSKAVRSEKEFATALGAWDQKEPLFIEAAFEAEPYRRMTDGLR